VYTHLLLEVYSLPEPDTGHWSVLCWELLRLVQYIRLGGEYLGSFRMG